MNIWQDLEQIEIQKLLMELTIGRKQLDNCSQIWGLMILKMRPRNSNISKSQKEERG